MVENIKNRRIRNKTGENIKKTKTYKSGQKPDENVRKGQKP